jgi:hypothetical protein
MISLIKNFKSILRFGSGQNRIYILLTIVTGLTGCMTAAEENSFTCKLPGHIDRPWIGSRYWANPLQDWRLNNGRIECWVSGGERSLFLLTHRLAEHSGGFVMSVRLGRLDRDQQSVHAGFAGFYLGVRGIFDDYRDDAVHGRGFPAGVTTAGKLMIGGLAEDDNLPALPLEDLYLEVQSKFQPGGYTLVLSARDSNDLRIRSLTYTGISPGWLTGGVSLACHWGELSAFEQIHLNEERHIELENAATDRGGDVKFWFSDWHLSGSKVKQSGEQVFGPILFAQYTLSRGVMKMTAQLPPVGQKDPDLVSLEIKTAQDQWEQISRSRMDELARTATFRVEPWDNQKDTPYRLHYGPFFDEDQAAGYFYYGTIRKEPKEKSEIVIAAFTGNNDLGFPNRDIIGRLINHNPDLLFFSGDQIYERVAGFGIEREPLANAVLDYLRKWYLYGWAYRDLLKDRPAVSIPDDHDVYHGNLWGDGGKAVPAGKTGYEAQDPGGYRMHPDWVNMVQRTQTSHLPDPFDPAPVDQGIGVYFCQMNYAGISFAILEDRKFKSSPQRLLPEARVVNGWVQNPHFDAKRSADVPGAVLLGERQLTFLNEWAADWSDKTWMKVVLSQTIFSNVATLPVRESSSDNIVPKLRILQAGEYPPDDVPVSDMDSNGWPQSGRNKALKTMRKAFAFHIAGDQHLGSTIQYGIDTWHDAGFAFCVPAISNVWPRRWYPVIPGKNRRAEQPRYTGDFEDGFGNKMTVLAVSNPVFSGLEPGLLYDRATGYGIIRFNRDSRKIVIECWPRRTNPSNQDIRQYEGWPLIVHQYDDVFLAAPYFLPQVNIAGLTEPVVQVRHQASGEMVYTLRIRGISLKPKVFTNGLYQIRVGEPGTDQVKVFSELPATTTESERTIQVSF